MIKKLLLAAVLALPFGALAQKFGVVDLQKVYESMPETTAMQTRLQEHAEQIEKASKELEDEINRLYTEFQKIANDPAVAESIKDLKRQDIEKRVQNAQMFQNKSNQDIQQLQQQLMAPIQAQFEDAVKAVGTEGGFTFVFPNEPGLLLYTGTDVVNVTETVINKLNQARAAAAAK